MVHKMHQKHSWVICEGKNQSADVKFITEFSSNTLVIHLLTPLEECIASVRSRGHTLSEASIERTYHKCQRDLKKLRSAGVEVLEFSRAEALWYIRKRVTLWSG
jgi:gamma-glutamyl phosphate reductase